MTASQYFTIRNMKYTRWGMTMSGDREPTLTREELAELRRVCDTGLADTQQMATLWKRRYALLAMAERCAGAEAAIVTYTAAIELLRLQASVLANERDDARAALRKYGVHYYSCAQRKGDECTCGLSAALGDDDE